MKRNLFAKTVAATLLASAALFAGAARADSGYMSITFGEPGGFGAQYWQGERHHPPRFGDHHPGRGYGFIDARQAEQRDRIRDGIRSGELTPYEVERLLREQRGIEHMERRFLADGRLDPYERQRLFEELDEANRHIYQEKHDAQDRDDYRGHWRGY